MSNLNINQEAMTPVVGLIDMELPDGAVMTVQVSANQATALKPGQFVVLDTTVTPAVAGLPQVIAATQGVVGLGFIPFNTRASSFAAGDKIEIALYGVVWMENTSAAAIVPMALVSSDTTGLKIITNSGQAQRGIALDYIPASGMGRIRVAQIGTGAA